MKYLLLLIFFVFGVSTFAEENVLQPWSLNVGISGQSSSSFSQFTVGLEARYLWVEWTESSAGFSISFGDSSALGLSIGQRFYAPIYDQFHPFVQAQYRVTDLAHFDTAYFDLGAGAQLKLSADTFFELQFTYAIPVNTQNSEGTWFVSGGSGIRF